MTNVTTAMFVFCCLFKAPFTLHFDNFTTAATARKNLYPRIHYVTSPSRLLQAPQRSVPFPSHSRRFPVGRHSPCSPACVYRRAVLYGARGDVTRGYYISLPSRRTRRRPLLLLLLLSICQQMMAQPGSIRHGCSQGRPKSAGTPHMMKNSQTNTNSGEYGIYS